MYCIAYLVETDYVRCVLAHTAVTVSSASAAAEECRSTLTPAKVTSSWTQRNRAKAAKLSADTGTVPGVTTGLGAGAAEAGACTTATDRDILA